jgi:hypothetical protein
MAPAVLPSCPHLPPPRAAMDWRDLRAHGTDRGPEFYLTALRYGHYLWRQGRAARAILCLDRAMGADLRGPGGAAARAAWPLPYAALTWMLEQAPPGVFLGNPRIHYQHLAARMNNPRRDQRRWRAWACGALARRVRPQWPGDPGFAGREPGVAVIAARLRRHGSAGEAALWRRVLARSGRAPRHPAAG